jgi:superfamily II DNA/RNA helicase
MKLDGLHVFLLLLAGIVLCSLLNDNKIREGAAGSMVASRRHDPDKLRELQNYKRESMKENKKLHERLHRLERQEKQHKQENKMAIKKAIKQYERQHDKDDTNDEYQMYDRHDKLYDRMHKERFDDIVHFDVDDHSIKRQTRNRAKMESLSHKMPNRDKYMLKTEVVPPADCPNSPQGMGPGSGMGPGTGPSSGAGGAVPPCPPCARCPEPAFECKKVPNYSSSIAGSSISSAGGLPKPVLSDFSTFGA